MGVKPGENFAHYMW